MAQNLNHVLHGKTFYFWTEYITQIYTHLFLYQNFSSCLQLLPTVGAVQCYCMVCGEGRTCGEEDCSSSAMGTLS